MNLFQLGQFTLNSGEISAYKIDCDALTDNDWACLAYIVSRQFQPFGSVEGVPRGGLKLAEHLVKYATAGPLLIVDDVVTTGNSMERHRAGRRAYGVAVFNRSTDISLPPWMETLFSMRRTIG